MRLPPWYPALETWLASTDQAVDVVLAVVILISLFMLIQPSQTLRVLWTIYLVSP